jgi:hypothetical protein
MRNPAYVWPHIGLAAIHHELGDLRSARNAVATASSLNRRVCLSFVRDVLPFRVAAHRERLLAACEAAGMRSHEVAMSDAAVRPASAVQRLVLGLNAGSALENRK